MKIVIGLTVSSSGGNGHATLWRGLCRALVAAGRRLDEAAEWLRMLGGRYVRTGLSWADSFRPDAEAWFDRQMRALAEFDVTLTFCFTPEHRGVQPHHANPPLELAGYADFCARMVRRYVTGGPRCGSGTEPIGREVVSV
ncbi:MAG TPA: hypothetical protein VHE61_04920 [Opitutaceae bacterium]|nr:hypothetical protein [Opitutaceae bacterium]